MTRRMLGLAAVVLAVVMTVPAFSQDLPRGDGRAGADLAIEKQQALVKANEASLVVVEYQLQFDKGEAPRLGVSRYAYGGGISNVIEEERPLERPGILVDGTHVVTDDVGLHPRFIKGIKVRRYGNGEGDARVDATVSAYPRQQDATILELAGPIAGAEPAAFDAKKEGPFFLLVPQELQGKWSVSVDPFNRELHMIGGKAVVEGRDGLVVDKEGTPVAVSTGDEMAADAEWRGNPMAWPAYTQKAMSELLAKVDAGSMKGIVPVTLNFRSPKASSSVRERFGPDEENATVQHVLGVVMDDHTVAILAELKPTQTSRLERIRVMSEPPVDAKFKATLKDYGVLVAESEKPLAGGLGISKADVADLRGATIPTADILLQGEKRVSYVQPRRIDDLARGFRGNLYPQVRIDDEAMFLFDPQGDLLALPVSQRDKSGGTERYRSSSNLRLTAVAQLAKTLSSLKDQSDPNNVPRTEDEENRLAYVGVEMQQLSRELARINNVSDQTRDGETGAMITYVYPDSPAEKAGVATGWILLRVNVEGQPKPLEVRMEADAFGDEPFPWTELDREPEQYFDKMPSPWPNAESPLIRALTDVGFGKKFVAEFWHDGKVDKKEFTVSQGPATFVSAPKFKHAGLGVTVKDQTYEVRRYFQRKADDPGVVISRVEIGSKASVSGLRPYEVITHVNDQPVMNVQDFEKLSKDQAELRLSIKRMTVGRIVKVSVAKSTTAPAPPPAPLLQLDPK